VHDIRVISMDHEYYHGWPTIARRANGELLLVYSGGREDHVCPFGRVELMRSHDSGANWTWPQVLLDGPIDDRDSGICVTPRGAILVTTFTSVAYVPLLEDSSNWPEQRRSRWKAAHERIDEPQRRRELGVWMIKSDDGGVTWSERYDPLVNSPHGPIPLKDGRLLYAGKDLWREGERVGVCDSIDDGRTWRWLSTIPTRDGDRQEEYHELHAVETTDGRILVHIRNHNPMSEGETLQSDSGDGGQSWSVPRSIGVWGLPSHLMRLKDDRLLMTYGHRRAPLGNQARVSNDQGQTWSAPIPLPTTGGEPIESSSTGSALFRSTKNGKLFCKTDFDINMRDRTITCPNGQGQPIAFGTVVVRRSRDAARR
jgi:hypothetical protein